MKKFLFIQILLVVFITKTVLGQEQEWIAPEDQVNKTAPAMFTPEMQKSGEDIYQKNCKSCHGDIGKNNMAKLNPLPKDLSSATVASQTDGTLHYKITNGKGLMPVFKNTLSSTQIWDVISYIRTFHKDYVQPQPSVISGFGGKALTLSLEYLPDLKKFKVLVSGKENNKDVPAEGVEVALFVKRYFGNLPVEEAKTSNKSGEIIFGEPQKLPADKEGNIHVIAKITDSEKYGDIIIEKEVKAGIPTDKPSLTESRAMWNVVRKAPWWITISYPLAVLAVLGTILYILLLLKKIFAIGKKQTVNENL